MKPFLRQNSRVNACVLNAGRPVQNKRLIPFTLPINDFAFLFFADVSSSSLKSCRKWETVESRTEVSDND